MAIKYLKDEDIKKMAEHKYQNGGWSKLDYVMDGFWKWLQAKLPRSLSPNYLTLTGGAFLISGVFLIWCYDNTFKSDRLPSLLYLYGAFCIFAVQTFDAIDGKHARETGQSTMLGQLLDHGLDSFTNTFLIAILLQSNLFGGGFCTFIVQSLTHFLFFLHSWEENYTGIFSTSVNNVGGTEFQFQAIFICLLPVFISHETLQKKLLFNMNTPELITCILVFSALSHIYTFMKLVHPKVKKQDYFYLIIPIFFITLVEGLVFFTNIWKERTLELLVFNGVLYGFYCLKYLISIMTKNKEELISLDYLLYLVAIIISLIMNDINLERKLFGGVCIFVVVRYIHYFFSICVQVKNYLGINF